MALVVGAALFAITEIPYRSARAASPPEHRFLGMLRWVDDLNMYFSFIRQAADGHVLFEDRLTHVPHDRVLFNLQFLAVGLLMRLTGPPDTLAFGLWRAGGILALVGGFLALLRAMRVPQAQHTLALLLFMLGGGLGWLAVICGLEAPRVDLHSGFQPFAQALQNPNFSLPHGLVLVFLALLCRAEQEGRSAWYIAAALVALVEGLMRPYDLLSLWIALPMLALAAFTTGQGLRPSLLRMLPLLSTLPLFAYYVFLFRSHPVFKHWASQGRTEPPSLVEHLASFGVMGCLAAWRIVKHREHALGASDRVLLAWLVAVLVLVHGAKLVSWLPFATQAATSAMAPVVLLALPLLPSASWSALSLRGRWGWAGLLALNSLSSAFILQERSAVVSTHFNYYHLRTAELEAFAWLGQKVRPTDVILASYLDGNRLGRFVSARVTLGHYSVTPDSAAVQARIARLLSGELDGTAARGLLSDWRVRWVYYSPRVYPAAQVDRWPGCVSRYRERGVAIYECDTSQESPKAGGSQAGEFGEATVPSKR